MVESTVNVNFYKRVLLEELIEHFTNEVEQMERLEIAYNRIGITWSERWAYNKVIKHLEDKLEKFKEDTDE